MRALYWAAVFVAQHGEYCPPPGMHPGGDGRRDPSPQPSPRPAAPARNGQRERRGQAGQHAGPSSIPEADSGPRRGLRGLRGSRETIGARIAALPVRPDVYVDTGRYRGPEQRCRCRYQFLGRPVTWQVIKYLPGTQTFRPSPSPLPSPPCLAGCRFLSAQEGRSTHPDSACRLARGQRSPARFTDVVR